MNPRSPSRRTPSDRSGRNRGTHPREREPRRQASGSRVRANDQRVDAYDPDGEYARDAPAHRHGWPDANDEYANTVNTPHPADAMAGGDYLAAAEQPDDRAAQRRAHPRRAPAGYGLRSGYAETATHDDDRSGLYGHRGEQDYDAQRGSHTPYGTQSGNEFARAGGHRGKAPRGYVRSDKRIREDLCERLMEDDRIDPSDVGVTVKDGVVTLDGTVEQRWIKHNIEDMAEACAGVRDIVNHLRVAPGGGAARDASRTD